MAGGTRRVSGADDVVLCCVDIPQINDLIGGTKGLPLDMDSFNVRGEWGKAARVGKMATPLNGKLSNLRVQKRFHTIAIQGKHSYELFDAFRPSRFSAIPKNAKSYNYLFFCRLFAMRLF